MRIVQVCPQEEPRSPDLIQPCDRIGDDEVAAPLSGRRDLSLAGRGVAICLKTLREAAVGVQHDGAHERTRVEPAGAEDLGQRGVTFGERGVGVVAHAVRYREQTRHQARVGRQRQRRHARRPIEHHPLPRQLFQGWHRGVHQAVGRQTIGARRVEGDEDNANRRLVPV
jgi:hypothetical protein